MYMCSSYNLHQKECLMMLNRWECLLCIYCWLFWHRPWDIPWLNFTRVLGWPVRNRPHDRSVTMHYLNATIPTGLQSVAVYRPNVLLLINMINAHELFFPLDRPWADYRVGVFSEISGTGATGAMYMNVVIAVACSNGKLINWQCQWHHTGQKAGGMP